MTKDSFLDIDEYNLPAECRAQATLFHEYADKLAAARNHLEREKERMELIEAELQIKIAANPEAAGLAKTTEAMIRAAMLRTVKHQNQAEVLRKAKSEERILDAAVKALGHRKSMIEQAVALHLQDLRSNPRVPAESREEVEEDEKRRIRRRSQRRRRETP